MKLIKTFFPKFNLIANLTAENLVLRQQLIFLRVFSKSCGRIDRRFHAVWLGNKGIGLFSIAKKLGRIRR
ncbi:MAG: hypothetical protein GY777_11850 [Candidatus Brocadiaceae bacterium]|nr:hypothetical protein [Candidatus Brocadiaceae bacterium]